MWNSKRRMCVQDNSSSPYVVGASVCKSSNFYESTPVDAFRFESVSRNGRESFILTSDIYMLFNQQRLDRMSRERLIAYFENLSVSEPKMRELRSKLSDDQLCSFVKSRFIQSPSELMAWSRYLMSSQDEMIAAAAAEKQTEQPARYEVDPTQEP